ncbi:hypothetical protein HKX48_005490, partial [Thoreauomyces humboldtii]
KFHSSFCFSFELERVNHSPEFDQSPNFTVPTTTKIQGHTVSFELCESTAPIITNTDQKTCTDTRDLIPRRRVPTSPTTSPLIVPRNHPYPRLRTDRKNTRHGSTNLPYLHRHPNPLHESVRHQSFERVAIEFREQSRVRQSHHHLFHPDQPVRVHVWLPEYGCVVRAHGVVGEGEETAWIVVGHAEDEEALTSAMP